MQVLQIALDVSSALQHLSACGVFHCDLKTDNVMLVAAQGELAATASGCKFRAKLVDFGLSVRLVGVPCGGLACCWWVHEGVVAIWGPQACFL